MNFIKRLWIIEIVLLLVAIGGLGVAVTNQVAAGNQRGEAFTTQSGTITDVAGVTDGVPEGGNPSSSILTQDETGEEREDGEEMESKFDGDFSDEDVEDEGDVDDEAGEEMDEEMDGEMEEEDEFSPLDVAARVMGLDVEAVEQAAWAGQSLAEIANENGVGAPALIAALIEQETAFVDGLQRAGHIRRDEADGWRNEIVIFTPFFVNTPYVEPEVIMAQMLGVEPEVLWEMLEEGGQTIGEIAVAQGVDVQVVVATVVASEGAYVDEMLVAGLIDVEEAEEWKAEVAEMAERMVTLGVEMWEVEE